MKKNTFAWLRIAAAMAAALVLLAVTGFAFTDLISGPTEITDGTQLQEGAYVQVDLTYIMSFCGVEKNSAGEETAYYAIAPIGNKFVLVRFDAAEHAKAAALEDATGQYLMGESETLPFHLVITGTAVRIEQAQGELMAQWFNDNGEWMLAAGVITQVDNFGDYLWTVQINADTVNGVKTNTAVILSVAALVLAVYAIAELVLLGCGVYDTKKKKTVKKSAVKIPSEAAVRQAEPVSAPASPEAAPAGEDSAHPEEAAETAADAEAMSPEESDV